jgi:hypothetical protein
MKKYIAIFAALLAIMLAASCSNILEPPKAAVDQGADGTLVVSIGGTERTLAPDTSDLDGLSYSLLLRRNNDIVYDGEFDGTATFSLSSQYTYAVIVEARDSGDNLIARASNTNVYISAGETTWVNLALTPVLNGDVPGIFKWDISYPDSDVAENAIGYSGATLTLTPYQNNSGTVTVNMFNDPEKKAGELELPPGVYTMTIQITSTRQIQYNSLEVNRREIVYIYPRLTTEAEYAFTLDDFTAGVRFSGTAVVYESDNSTINEDYVPVEVMAFDDDRNIVETAPITLNDDTGDYEWELFVSSHELKQEGSFTQAKIQFKANHVSGANRYMISSTNTPSVTYPHGATNVSLSIQTAALSLSTYLQTLPGTGGSINFNPDVARSGGTDFTITTPANYGLRAGSVRADWNYANLDKITTENGVISVNVPVPNNAAPTLSAEFFHLKGTVTVNGLIDGYAPAKIAAYEPDDEGEYTILIAEAVPAQVGGTDSYTYEIPIPAGYVWRSSNNNSRLVTTLTAAEQPDYEDKSDVYIPNFTTDANEFTYSFTLFTVQGIQTTTLGTNSIRISWDEAEWAASGYKVYLGNTTGTPIATVAADVTSYDYTSASLTAGNTYYFYVVGRRTATADGNASNASGRVQQPQPTTFNFSTDTSNGFLSSVTLSWTAVTTGSGYTIERYNSNSGYWQWVWDNSSSSTTSWTDNDPPRINANITYRITAKDSWWSSANSVPKESSTFSAPWAQYMSSGSTYDGYIYNSGQKNLYYNDSGYYNLYVYLYDTGNPYNNETLDAYVDVYATGGDHLGGFDSANGSPVYNYGQPVILVVRAYDNTSTGSYYIMINGN